MFSQASVILLTGSVCLSQHAPGQGVCSIDGMGCRMKGCDIEIGVCLVEGVI